MNFPYLRDKVDFHRFLVARRFLSYHICECNEQEGTCLKMTRDTPLGPNVSDNTLPNEGRHGVTVRKEPTYILVEQCRIVERERNQVGGGADRHSHLICPSVDDSGW